MSNLWQHLEHGPHHSAYHGRVPVQLILLSKCGTRTWMTWGCFNNNQRSGRVPDAAVDAAAAAAMKDAVKTWRKIPDWSARWSASSASSPLLSVSPPSCHSQTATVTTQKEPTREGGWEGRRAGVGEGMERGQEGGREERVPTSTADDIISTQPL